jgi:ribosomal protein S18 acetylase RimI-like enzyme
MAEIEAVRRILYTDPVWSAYAIADLQPSVADSCTWHTGDGNVEDGLVMFYCGLKPPVLFAIGPADAVAQALDRAPRLPDEVYVSIRTEHEDVISTRYDYTRDRRPMLRMVLRRAVDMSVPELHNLVSLHSDDATRLLELYSRGGDFAPDAFDAEQIANGVFYGIENANGELIAAGGTHIVDWDAGIGAIGNFYTRPEQRRKGYAGALLSAIVRDLRAGNVDTIVLNVDERNTNAAALYEHHGFAVHCPFVEGVGRRIVQRST